MGAILAGIIQGLGQHAQQKNTVNVLAQQSANEEMGKAFDALAEQTNDPTEQLRIRQLGMQARQSGAKKLPASMLQQHQQIIQGMADKAKQQQQAQQSQQTQQIQQAMPTVQQGVTGSPDAAQGANGTVSRAPGGIPTSLPSPGVPPPNPTSAAALPAPAAAAQSPEQIAAAAPPPVSGLPSPGFNGLVGPASSAARQAGMVAMAGVPAEVAKTQMLFPYEIQKIAAQVGLKNKADIALFRAKWEQAQDFINQQKNTGSEQAGHWGNKIVNGMPEPYEDNGQELPRLYLGSHLPLNAKIVGGETADPKQTYTLRRYRDGALEAFAADVGQRTAFDINGNPVQYNPYVPGSAEAGGAVAPPLAAPKQENLQGGGVGFVSPGQAAAGVAPTAVPGTIGAGNPTVTNVPGQLPSTRTRGAASGAAAPIAAPPAAGLPAPAGSGNAKPLPGDRIAAQKYKDWQAGGPAPTGKELTAVQDYASRNGLETPIALSSLGQKNLQAVDAVFKEIDDADKILRDIKGSPYLGAEYLKYKNGFSTPYDALFTKLSFEGLRSAAAVLQGNNSRAYPVIKKAFEHVPNLDRLAGLNPDSISLMKDKLKAMRDVLTDTRSTIMEDETKSGVVRSGMSAPGVTPPSSMVNMRAPSGQVSPVPADQVEHYKARGAVVVP